MNRLKEMIKDEREAPSQYYKLLKTLTPQERKVVRPIIKQEKKHYQILTKLRENKK